MPPPRPMHVPCSEMTKIVTPVADRNSWIDSMGWVTAVVRKNGDGELRTVVTETVSQLLCGRTNNRRVTRAAYFRRMAKGTVAKNDKKE